MICLLLVLPEDSKLYYYNVFLLFIITKHRKTIFQYFLAFSASRTQQFLLFQCFLAFSAPRTQQTLLFQYFPPFSASRTQQTLFVQCLHAFYGSRTQQNLLFQCFPTFSASRTQQTILFQCFPTFSASRTQHTSSFQCFSCFFCFQNTEHFYFSNALLLCFRTKSKGRVGDGGVLGAPMRARKHKKQKSIEQIKFLCSGSRKRRKALT